MQSRFGKPLCVKNPQGKKKNIFLLRSSVICHWRIQNPWSSFALWKRPQISVLPGMSSLELMKYSQYDGS